MEEIQADKSLKLKKKKLNKYDSRGVQTLFRTLSRNHYNLLRQVDQKASIILTINSIIISIFMGASLIAPAEVKTIIAQGSRILTIFSLVSMVFAVISMLPHRYFNIMLKGSGYKGSLYASNFVSQSLEEFQAEINRIISTGDNIYTEMTNDLYFLGKIIHGKQRTLILSAAIFIIGLITTIVVLVSKGF